jgi:hypothetical protein
MAKFDLKKAILENKATFFGSLTEGQFSWMTQDTGQQIGSQDENKISVYMFDNKGKYWFERDYDGYGVFGGMDYYELLDQMNGGSGDRSKGIDLAFDKSKEGETLFPALVVSPSNFNYKTHDFTKEAEHDPNQSWYAPEEEEDFIDQNDEEEYGYNDDEEEDDMMEGKKQYYKDAEADDAEHIKALEKDMKDDKTSGKMKMSEFKAKIKEMILNEMEDEKVVDVNDETPESEEDFLAELEGMLDEADETEKDTAEAEDVTVDDTETIDTETEVEVDPNVKAVQDALTQAQVAAQKLGDPKLTDQIGNTITFFTREHVVEKPKSAVAEGDLMKNIGKGLEYEATEEMIRDYATGLLNNLKDNSHQFSDAEDLFDFYLANPQDFPKSMDYNFFKNNYDDILSLAMTGLNEGKKEDKKEKDVAKDLNESMFPMLKKILK